MARPSPASSLISRWISALAPDVHALRGLVEDQSFGPAASQRARATFCWLPPERLPTGASSVGVLIPSRRTNAGGGGALAAVVEQPEPRVGAERGQRGVGRRRHLEDHAVPTAVLGHVGDPHRDGPTRRVDRDRAPAEPDLARVGGRQAEEDPRQLGPPRANQARQPHDLAGAPLRSTSRTPDDPAAQPADLQHDVARLGGDLGEDGRELAPDHHPDQLGAGDLGHPPRPDQGARRATRSPGRRSAAAPPAGARCR